jgi:hypothetical protein
VPVILPPDVRETLKFITDSHVRELVGIQEDNKYVFGSKGKNICQKSFVKA